MVVQHKRPVLLGLAATGILLVPLIAMQFTEEVNWNLMDFLIAGLLLFGAGAILEIAFRTITKRVHRIIAGLLVLFSLLLVWAELAVGIFGSPLAGS